MLALCALRCLCSLFVCLPVVCNCVEFPARCINKPRPRIQTAWGGDDAGAAGYVGLLVSVLVLALVLVLMPVSMLMPVTKHMFTIYQCQHLGVL